MSPTRPSLSLSLLAERAVFSSDPAQWTCTHQMASCGARLRSGMPQERGPPKQFFCFIVSQLAQQASARPGSVENQTIGSPARGLVVVPTTTSLKS
jgi:hypothetical protein